METNQIFSLVFIMVVLGFLLGAGILALDKFSDASRDTYTIVNESINASALNKNAINVTLANIPVKEITWFRNKSHYTATSPRDYNITNLNTGTVQLFNASGWLTGAAGANQWINVSYKYYSENDASTSLSDSATEVGNVSDQWLGLIITVSVLSIILTLIVGSFIFRKR